MVSYANSAPENANDRYNSELDIIESLYAFHPDAFDSLGDDEMTDLRKYYLLGEAVPEDVFAHRTAVVAADSDLVTRAQDAFRKICRELSIDDIHYPH